MSGLLGWLLQESPFLAHGYCLQWNAGLLGLHVFADMLIGLSYFSIPIALIVFGLRRRDLRYRWMLHLFAAFILLCGTTHFVAVLTIWEPVYALEGVVKAATAAVSLATATVLWPLLPKALALPSPDQFATANAALTTEIEERRGAERRVRELNAALETRVRERTAELEAVVEQLMTEIRERETAQRDLAKAREQAVASDRAKTEFLAHMSHELRTPLNVVLGYAEVIAERTLGPDAGDRYIEYARTIHKSGSHLLNIINDMLDLSKIEAGAYDLDEGDHALPELAEEVVELMTPKIEADGLTLDVRTSETLPHLRCDRRVVLQAILNLLSNAAKFTPAGGRLVLSMTMREADGGTDITISDTGIGMTQADVARALEPFGQAANSDRLSQQGTGLGLPLCRRFVELHGGRLAVASAPDRGTTVRLSFPAERSVRT